MALGDALAEAGVWAGSEMPAAAVMKAEKKLGAGIWRMGRISKLSTSADGVSRVATIEYRSPEEKTFRETVRSLRAIAVVHRETELDIIQQLNGAAKDANTVYYLDKR